MKKRVLIILECMLIMTMFVTTAMPANAETHVWYRIYKNGVFDDSNNSKGEGNLIGSFNVPGGQIPTGIFYSNGVLTLDSVNIYDLDLRGYEGKIVLKGNSVIGSYNSILIDSSIAIYPYERNNPIPIKVEMVAEPGAKLTLKNGIALWRIILENDDGTYLWLQDTQFSLGKNTKSSDPNLNFIVTSDSLPHYYNHNEIVIYYDEPTTVATTSNSTTTKKNFSQGTTKRTDVDKTTTVDTKKEKTTAGKSTGTTESIETTVEGTVPGANTSTKVETTTKATPQPAENESNTGKIIGICIGATAAIGCSAALFFFVIKPKLL